MSGRRISVRSLGYYMLKKLWLILLCMLALGFLLVGYKYLKDKKNQEDAENQEDTSVNLSATDLNDAKNAVIQYRYAKQMEKYLKESPLMKVDASKEKQTVVEYRIKMRLPVPVPLKTLICSCSGPISTTVYLWEICRH